MRLAIVGDTHYTNFAYHKEALAGRGRTPTAGAQITRRAWNTEHVLPRLVSEVRAAAPDLVIQLGDVNHGHTDDAAGDIAEFREALDYLRQIGRPLLFARGTHEGPSDGPVGDAYREIYLTEIARTLGVPRHGLDTSYGGSLGGVRLIVLDYTTFKRDGPADHLLQHHLAEGARVGERIVVCGHPPLIPSRGHSSRALNTHGRLWTASRAPRHR
jgi:3',5'-cyclic AMP phosphodiesterase CpdA